MRANLPQFSGLWCRIRLAIQIILLLPFPSEMLETIILHLELQQGQLTTKYSTTEMITILHATSKMY